MTLLEWWFYPGITIVSDGFTTHGGEGRTGLSTVLGVIKFYQIPLLEVWIHDKRAFDELIRGTLTEEMFDEVQEGQKPYNWKFYPLPRVEKVRKGSQHSLEVRRADGHIIFDVQLP